jgi:hypothetical protein
VNASVAESDARIGSLEGRRFVAVENVAGEGSAATAFEYHQDGDLVWARYSGGAIRLGFLVGTRTGDRLEIRYSHLNIDGGTANGRCSTVIGRDSDGFLTLDEKWQWESRPGRGTSLLREVTG